MTEMINMERTTTENNLKNGVKPEGEQYELAKNTIAMWPEWKREIFNRLMHITT